MESENITILLPPRPYFGKKIIFMRDAAYVWTVVTRKGIFICRYRKIRLI